MKMARIGVLLDEFTMKRSRQYGLNSFQRYVTEILSHVGISFEVLESAEQAKLEPPYDAILAAVAGNDPNSLSLLYNYVSEGGTLIAYGGLNGLANRLNAKAAPLSASGYATLPDAFGDNRPLRFLASNAWLPMEEDESCIERIGRLHRQSPDGEQLGSALLGYAIGKGTLHRWAIDIPFMVVHLQQGVEPVLRDGVPAPDGSAPINENILKADDGCVLDWEFDRLRTETGQPYFAHPYADLWREVLIAHLLQTVTRKGLTLPFLGYWPDGVERIAMISHDSDLNSEEAAETTLRLLEEQDIHSCWCMIEPGYSPNIYEKIKAAGHELAFHYNGLLQEGGIWGRDEFHRQFNWLKGVLPQERPISNKNHYTYLEGWGELFVWCEEAGLQVDQSRGPSKRGNVGFPFGTCHPYFPIAWADEANRIYNVLEIGFLTQDLDIGYWSDSSVVVPFLEQIARVQGVAHFLFHQHHLHTNENAAKAFKLVVSEATKRGFHFWTSAEVNAWERARRSVSIKSVDADHCPILSTDAEISIPKGLVVWVPVIDKPEEAVQTYFGVPCKKYLVG